MQEKRGFVKSVVIVTSLVAILWAVFGLQQLEFIHTYQFGNIPRHIAGLKGIIFSPFLHGSVEHLVSNTIPVIVLLMALLNAYPRVAFTVLTFVHIVSGLLVWLLAPGTGVHIGISGIIYGLAFFLISSGFFRKDRTSVTIAIFTGLMYGGMVGGFMPEAGVSWQSHLYGALSGIAIAFFLRNKYLPPKHEFELEKTEDEKHFFDT